MELSDAMEVQSLVHSIGNTKLKSRVYVEGKIKVTGNLTIDGHGNVYGGINGGTIKASKG